MMEDFQQQTYGDRIADEYDQIHAHLSTPEHVAPIVDVLADLDRMARPAGMMLRRRWADWQGSPFTASSTNHVSVYELLPGGG